MWAWALLPISLAILGIAGVWIVYAIAVSNGSVDITLEFPFISVCGSYPPQSCIFAQILNVGAVFAIWICIMRYQQIRDCGHSSHLNTASLAMGIITAIGTSIVGNFQQSFVISVHLVGAFLAFVVGNIYFWTQSILTYQLKPLFHGCMIGAIRFAFCIISTAMIVMMIVFFAVGRRSESAICEWIAAMILFLLFGSFANEFYYINGMVFHVMKTKTAIPSEMDISTITLNF
uniref:Transmembrane protein 150B n=1 Tax=Leptobrachium leishanense TaxID=445787 RepID=A0A8C5MTB1_9ANUR